MLRRKRHCGKTLCESADAADFRKIVTGSKRDEGFFRQSNRFRVLDFPRQQQIDFMRVNPVCFPVKGAAGYADSFDEKSLLAGFGDDRL